MTKKIMCVVISLIMLISTVSIAANASYSYTGLKDDAYEWYWSVGWDEYDYDSQPDWKAQIDRRFLFAYRQPSNYTTIDEEQLERNLSFFMDEIIAEYHAAEAQLEAATTDEEREAANRRFFDLYKKMATPMDGDLFQDRYWYQYRDLTKEKTHFKYEIQDNDGNVVSTVKPGEEYNIVAYVTTNYLPFIVSVGIICDRPYVNFAPDHTTTGGSDSDTVTTYADDLICDMIAGALYIDYGYQSVDPDYPVSYFRTQAFKDDFPNGEEIYRQVRACIRPDDNCEQRLYDNEKVCSLKFTVDPDTPVGTTLNFWNEPKYCLQSLDEWLDLDNYGPGRWSCMMFQMFRIADPIEYYVAADDSDPIYLGTDEYPGIDLTFENASVEVVSAEADLADYTELDNSIAAYEELESGKALYTADSWSAYEDAYNAAKSLARDLAADEQATVDSANAALVDAKAALAENSVVSATVANRGDTSVTVNVEVTGTPTALRLANSESSLTYNRTDATITTAENGNENWEIEVAASGAANSYTVSALYGTAVANQTATFSYDALKDPNFISLDIPGAYSEEGYKDRVYKGKNEMKVVTTQDVWKIQFVQDGGTYTYATDYTPYVDNEDGTRTWTINHVFGPVGDVHLDVRIRLRNTSFYNVNESIDVEVVY